MFKRKPRDLNMRIAIEWGSRMSYIQLVPDKLLPIEKRAKFVLEIEKVFPKGYIPEMPYERVQIMLMKVYKVGKKYFPDNEHRDEVIGFCLRLWAGTMIASKCIARGTRSGINTNKIRKRLARSVEQDGVNDPIVAAGIDCAPMFKAFRKEHWMLDGIEWFNWLFQNNNNKSPHE